MQGDGDGRDHQNHDTCDESIVGIVDTNWSGPGKEVQNVSVTDIQQDAKEKEYCKGEAKGKEGDTRASDLARSEHRDNPMWPRDTSAHPHDRHEHQTAEYHRPEHQP